MESKPVDVKSPQLLAEEAKRTPSPAEPPVKHYVLHAEPGRIVTKDPKDS